MVVLVVVCICLVVVVIVCVCVDGIGWLGVGWCCVGGGLVGVCVWGCRVGCVGVCGGWGWVWCVVIVVVLGNTRGTPGSSQSRSSAESDVDKGQCQIVATQVCIRKFSTSVEPMEHSTQRRWAACLTLV